MMITGGYILVGADDNGQPAGEVEHPELFGPATLHAKLAKHLPRPFEIRSRPAARLWSGRPPTNAAGDSGHRPKSAPRYATRRWQR
jgi:hypothetical protein